MKANTFVVKPERQLLRQPKEDNMKTQNIILRKRRVRAKIAGNSNAPRLSVHASLAHIQAQVIDDLKGVTLASASDLTIKEKMTKVQKAEKVGTLVAELAKKAGVKKVVFDRGSKLYHGRVKALAEAARKGGLDF
jgi:large subunit ribosomal protein L18